MKRKHSACVIEAIESRLLLAVISVLNNDDSGEGSLRDAIAAAQSGDTVTLADRSGSITLATELNVDKDLNIIGPGAADLAISGNHLTRVLFVSAGSVQINDLTITQGGGVNKGAGIFNQATLALDGVVVSENTASHGQSHEAIGGGIYNIGALAMTDSSVLDNSATAIGADHFLQAAGGGIWSHTSGAGITLNRCTIANNTAYVENSDDWADISDARGGGMLLQGTGASSMTNCTISGNAAHVRVINSIHSMITEADGGAIYSAMQQGNPLTLTNCTIVNNAAIAEDNNHHAFEYGGGFRMATDGGGTITNCIIANNAADYYPDFTNWAGHGVFSGGNNLIGQTDNNGVFVHGVNNDIVGALGSPIDPLVGALADNGGPTRTHALLENSPAINAGGSGAPAADQRGGVRNGAADIGAFEVGTSNHAPAFSSTAVTDATSESAYTYDVTTSDDDGDPLTITATTTLLEWLELTDNGDGTATLTGTPINADAGDLDVTLRVDDGTTHTDQSFTIEVEAINHAPGLAPAGATSAVAGVAFQQIVHATDPDDDDITISVVAKPDWITATDNGDGTATLAGTPSLGDGGAASVILEANDGNLDSQPRTYTIDVAVPRWQLNNGVLTVAGSSGDDSIQAWQRGNQVRVVRNGLIKNFPIAGITVVELHGFDGNDVLALNVKSMAGYAVGGAGNDTLTGGDEIDVLTGGGGKDLILGGGGDDRLNGHNGNDRLDGGAGNDRLYGGDGNDMLHGGIGADHLSGDSGDDVLVSRDAFIDVLDGGDGNDSAHLDASDVKDDLLALLV